MIHTLRCLMLLLFGYRFLYWERIAAVRHWIDWQMKRKFDAEINILFFFFNPY